MNKLITNNQVSNFYNELLELMKGCTSFIFNVAFINYSGVQLLLDTLAELENKKVKGKILTSTYLNFTSVEALEKLKSFENIDLRIFECEANNIGFHSKSYIFEFEDKYKILIGSSNLTSSAFKKNIEWNVEIINKKDDLFVEDVLMQFNKLYENSRLVDDIFLKSYSDFLSALPKYDKTFKINKELEINFMQTLALEKLDYLRKNRENKALAIAATGSGKTYLSAFDVKNLNVKRVLFLVHRENILINAKKTFESIIKNKKCGLFTGNKKELDCDYIFSTIQTMSNNCTLFSQEQFDYIIIDEAHHASSLSYKKIIDYFKPKFLLGLTATANRMDGENIYEIFDGNIACDIRLNDALDNNLVVPFFYFGINDIQVDLQGVPLDNIELLTKILNVNKRVDFIIEKIDFYSHKKSKRKILGFCVSKEHAKYMSDEFNKKGINSTFLTSNDSIVKREESIRLLQDDKSKLEVIFSVDIFNEGIDIPCVNMILMLRPTNSSIVFTQQLGRGLRKFHGKEYLTVLDFIGNHKKAYLISLALLGNKILDKESIKLSLLNNFANIQNAFINMDEISKNRILQQINSENFSSLKYLKEQYFEFKLFLGNKTPMLIDFINYDEFIDPIKFINESKSYVEFLSKVENSDSIKALILNGSFIKAIRFVDYLLPIKRVYEFVILKYLLSNEYIDYNIANSLLKKYLKSVDLNTIKHAFSYLNFEFFDSAQIKKYLKLVEIKEEKIFKSSSFSELLCKNEYKTFFEDSINYGIYTYEIEYGLRHSYLPFLKLYGKYNMLNIAHLCNFPKIHSSFRGSGFLKYENDFFLFINLHKEKFSKSSAYHNTFISKRDFTYQSKPSHSQEKGDGLRLIHNRKFGVSLHIFVRKFVQIDGITQNFMYLGLADVIKFWDNKPIFMELRLRQSLDDKLYEEFTKII